MSPPREILPGKIWLLTKRCTQRTFLLKPTPETRLDLGYLLARAARQAWLELLAWCFMANHYHAIVHDPLGRVPEFATNFHRDVARVFNVRWGRSESFWSSDPTCMTYLPTAGDVLNKIVYVLANPVAAHCVERADEWPGLSSVEFLDGRPRPFPRPDPYLRRGNAPGEELLQMVIPEVILGESQRDGWIASVRDELERRERRLAGMRREQGRPVMGLAAIAEMNHLDAPRTPVVRRRGIRPALASRDARERVQQIERLTGFRGSYDAARRKFAAGQTNAVFPPGTYRMRLLGACGEELTPEPSKPKGET